MSDYKIVRILDSTTYIASIPQYDISANKNIEFIVYYKGEEIIDPDTGNSLGCLEITKERCFLVDTQENFAIIRDVSTRENFLTRSMTISGYIQGNPRDMSKFLPEDEAKVKVGDYVKIIHLTTAST